MGESRPADSFPTELGEFALHGVLGQGGSGTVYKATWGHRTVALKVLHDNLVEADRDVERFHQEAALLQSVDHPGVVKVLGSGSLPDGRPYLIMELVEGQPLSDRIARGPLPIDSALTLFDQLARAVSALHQKGLIHRDVKPENVILTGQHAVLLDFGIAKMQDAPASTVTREGAVRGTPAYMAPERFFGQPAGVATDVYELAVVLYAMTTGRLPWTDHADPSARLNPTPPSQFGRQLPGSLESVLLEALSTRDKTRPPSIDELARRVKQAVAEGAGSGPRETVDMRSAAARRAADPALAPTAHARVRAPARRWPWLVLLVLMVAAGVVVAVALPSSDEAPAAAAEAGDAGVATAAIDAAGNALRPAAPMWPASQPPAGAVERALRHHPEDTLLLAGASLATLRQSSLIGDIVENKAEVGWLGKVRSTCGDDFATSIEYVTMGAAFDDESNDAALDVLIQGAPERAQVERCVAGLLSDGSSKVAQKRHGDATRMTGGRFDVWLAFAEPGLVLVTNRPNVDRQWLDQRLEGRDALAATDALPPLLGEVDTGSVWMIAVPRQSTVPLLLGTYPPQSLFASLRLDSDLAVYGVMRFEKANYAEQTALALQRQLDLIGSDPIARMLLADSGFAVRDRDAVFTLALGSTMAQVVVESIVEQMK